MILLGRQNTRVAQLDAANVSRFHSPIKTSNKSIGHEADLSPQNEASTLTQPTGKIANMALFVPITYPKSHGRKGLRATAQTAPKASKKVAAPR